MSRFLILIIFMLWLASAGQTDLPAGAWAARHAAGPVLFIGGYVGLVLLTALWGRWLARRVAVSTFQRQLKVFNLTMEAARICIGVWYAAGLFVLGWPQVIVRVVGEEQVASVVGVVLGTLPALGAWAGLWWSQYPADRALREENLLICADQGAPVHPPQELGAYMVSHLRNQILFMCVPLLLIVLGHDLSILTGTLLGVSAARMDFVDGAGWIVSTIGVFLLSSEILRRVLHTEPLPDTSLRRRLDALSRRTGIAYRDILLWKTDYSLGNAAVMGFLPQLRFILLSDLLLERMPDEEIEAVFAHEMGHIVHRHMIWYVVFIVVLGMLNVSSGQWIAGRLGPQAAAAAVGGFLIVKFLVLFGFVSRKFERQADVYAARTIQMRQSRAPEPRPVALSAATAAGDIALAPAPALSAYLPAPEPDTVWRDLARSHVGPHGAEVFGSALRRIAVVNNIPLATRSWCHGSIASRMQFLTGLSDDPSHTTRFDRFMWWMYASIVIALILTGGMFAWSMVS